MTKTADKDAKKMSNLDEKILAVLETPAENEAALDAVLKEEMSEDAVRAVRAALRLLDAFKDEIPSDTLAGLADAAGMDLHEEEMREEVNQGYQEMTKQEDSEALLKSDDLPAELRPTIEALWKSNQEAAERVAQLEQVLKSERDEKLLASETDRVGKSFGHVPGLESDKLAGMLIALRKAAPESADVVEELLTATERAMVAKSDGAFEEAGTTVPAEASGRTAWTKIESMAGELVTKGDATTRAQAIDSVLQDNPELYAAYLAEKA
jgi:hypothetical protein